MTTRTLTQSGQASAQRKARVAGVFYVLNTITSMYAFLEPRGRFSFASGQIAIGAYIVVTLLFYFLFKPVSRGVSLLAALAGMAGNVMGIVGSFHLVHFKINLLVFFGFYCVLIGYLIVRSNFLPRVLGVLMVLAGAGYLTFLWPPLGASLTPYNYLPGALGEWTLIAWLLIKGVNQQRWDEQADAARN